MKRCPKHDSYLTRVQQTYNYCPKCRIFWMVDADLRDSVFVYLADMGHRRDGDPLELQVARNQIENFFIPRLELDEEARAHAYLYARWYIDNYNEVKHESESS